MDFWAKHQDPVALAEVLGLESVESVKAYSQIMSRAQENVIQLDMVGQ